MLFSISDPSPTLFFANYQNYKLTSCSFCKPLFPQVIWRKEKPSLMLRINQVRLNQKNCNSLSEKLSAYLGCI